MSLMRYVDAVKAILAMYTSGVLSEEHREVMRSIEYSGYDTRWADLCETLTPAHLKVSWVTGADSMRQGMFHNSFNPTESTFFNVLVTPRG